MHKLRKAAVLAVALGSVGLLSGGAAHADGGGFGIQQSSTCRSHDLNITVLGQVGLIDGLLGNALNGEGNSGAQSTPMGSDMGCNNGVGK
ncbi:hypothetical protein GCM10022403_033410 [Streptomyces coacervatus]|uniref:Secreted protein n=1 Tax=Streptomyces coacervatus TaxID=647381 RepID=A0ABP7HLV8_9ACTN|nr:hypothetical protein [Streptomyces coacervatus]MDF2272330.1 hypothetical protein [Streptomyces coacervatus]